MLTNTNQEKSNTLMSWATSKPVMFGLGLGIGAFIYQAGILQRLTSKVFKKEKEVEKQPIPTEKSTDNNATASTSKTG
ncbi:MAG: hypothetical protein GBAus27B_000404 [Mycoplasmataceae bacterium]|nr:MAG: hypothetical protein GBAus27B_000404 [Mycoplasmataceae bacterium]